jgi:anti-sigma-K factor RskA
VNDRDLTASSGAYVLHALEPDDENAFLELIAHSEGLRTEVVELADTAVELGLAVPAEAPPAVLREAILAAIADLPQLEPESTAVVTPIARARRRRVPRLIAVLVPMAAAAAIVTAVGVGVILPTTPQARVAAVASAGDVRSATSAVVGGGSVRVSWSSDLDAAAVVPMDLPRLSGGRVYELWYLGDGDARAAGTFDGTGSTALDGRLRHGDKIGITVEPAGGSTTPTSSPIALIQT